ncbi:hypothetical protein [Haloferax chudinovii]|uniref:Tat pathway signal protein n=1 Tax=Haloferax chudinovii TaxID=1109010 RepID=A0ABD5XQ10_9EURY
MTGKVPRRGFLASIGASFLASGIASATGTSTPTQLAVVLKGDRKQPIRQKHITQARAEFLQQHGLDDGTKFALRSFAGGSSKRIIGYGIAIDNGVPVESVYTIPSPEQLIPADTDGPEKTDVSTKRTSEFTSISDSISQFHSDLDTFADGNRDPVVDSVSSSQTPTTQLAEPEPGWVKQGEINEATAVYWNFHGENIQVGRIDLDTEVWKSGDETRDYEDKYACALRGEMWPSPSIDHLNTPSIFRNEGSHLIQDWDRTSMGSPTITESSPDTEKN